jgi:hypothetical protein
MAVPYTFATATSAIPLSNLDSNFATAITIGSTAVYLGNTTTTIAGLTLTSPTLTTPALGTPASGVLTNTTGLPLTTGVTGTLPATNGGTGSNSAFTTNGVAYATSTSALATGSALTFDGTKLGIGTSSPSATLTVFGSNTAARGQLNVIGASTDDSRITLYRNGTFSGAISCTSTVMYIDAVEAVPMAFYTSDTERMRINATAPILCLSGGNTTATGTGIAFPATQSASSDANTLDDYEEGTFTPTLTINGVTTGITGNYYGEYIKIGRQVFVSFYIALTNKGSTSGNVSVGVFPFAITAPNNTYGFALIQIFNQASAFSAGIQINTSGTSSELKKTGITTDTSLNNSDLNNNTTFIGNFVYYA